MGLLSRSIFREVSKNALFGAVLFTFVLFLQRAGKLFAILVRSSAPPATVVQLFGLAIPFTLTFTVPLGVLVGVLLALSRMSGDGEIIAMRASGVPSRKVIAPVLLFASLAMLVTATASLWLTPYSTWRTYKVLNQLVAAELTSEVQPQIFDEGFPNRVVYISDVIPGAVARWRNVFIADTTPAEEQKKSDHDRGEGPSVTVAESGIAVPDVAHNQIQLSLQQETIYDVGKDPAEYYRSSCPAMCEQVLEATKPSDVHAKGYTEIDTIPLYRLAYRDKTLDHDNVIQARIELHQRLALPPGLFPAGADWDSVGHFVAQGRQIACIRFHRGAGVRLLDGINRRAGFGQATSASGGRGDVDPEHDLRGGGFVSVDAIGASGRPGPHRGRKRVDHCQLGSPAWNSPAGCRAVAFSTSRLADVPGSSSGG